jgi:hypothetical protein
MKRNAAIAAILLGAGAVIAHLHASMQSYHPVIKVAAPEDVMYTVVLDSMRDRPACSHAGKSFVEPMRAQCPDCQIVSARCERELAGLELELNQDRPVPMYVVSMAGVRVAIAADESRARMACNLIAGDAVSRGAPHAVCMFPAGD